MTLNLVPVLFIVIPFILIIDQAKSTLQAIQVIAQENRSGDKKMVGDRRRLRNSVKRMAAKAAKKRKSIEKRMQSETGAVSSSEVSSLIEDNELLEEINKIKSKSDKLKSLNDASDEDIANAIESRLLNGHMHHYGSSGIFTKVRYGEKDTEVPFLEEWNIYTLPAALVFMDWLGNEYTRRHNVVVSGFFNQMVGVLDNLLYIHIALVLLEGFVILMHNLVNIATVGGMSEIMDIEDLLSSFVILIFNSIGSMSLMYTFLRPLINKNNRRFKGGKRKSRKGGRRNVF